MPREVLGSYLNDTETVGRSPRWPRPSTPVPPRSTIVTRSLANARLGLYAPLMAPRAQALVLLSGPRAVPAPISGPQLRLAQEVALLGTLQGALHDAERQGDRRTVARIAPLVAVRVDKIAALTAETRRGAIEEMSDEALLAELARLREEQAGWG